MTNKLQNFHLLQLHSGSFTINFSILTVYVKFEKNTATSHRKSGYSCHASPEQEDMSSLNCCHDMQSSL